MTLPANDPARYQPFLDAIKRFLVSDDLVQVTECFVVTLSEPTGGATLGAQTTTTVSILDVNLPQIPDEQPNLNRLQLAGTGFGKSEEHDRYFVTNAYARFLGRTPDQAGFRCQVTLMAWADVKRGRPPPKQPDWTAAGTPSVAESLHPGHLAEVRGARHKRHPIGGALLVSDQHQRVRGPTHPGCLLALRQHASC